MNTQYSYSFSLCSMHKILSKSISDGYSCPDQQSMLLRVQPISSEGLFRLRTNIADRSVNSSEHHLKPPSCLQPGRAKLDSQLCEEFYNFVTPQCKEKQFFLTQIACRFKRIW